MGIGVGIGIGIGIGVGIGIAVGIGSYRNISVHLFKFAQHVCPVSSLPAPAHAQPFGGTDIWYSI